MTIQILEGATTAEIEDKVLQCPACGGANLHHCGRPIVEGYDGHSESVGLPMSCEGCSAELTLWARSHEGDMLMEFSVIRFKKYRKKPVVVEAKQWFKDGDHVWVRPHNIKEECGWIETLEGGHVVTPGDWIITGVDGEHYPCKPNIFSQTYDEVKE